MKITIPKTIDAARKRLNELGGLLTAKEWERAAIVYAFTSDGTRGGDTSIDSSVNGLTPNAFAALGITGLRSHVTVRQYRDAWKKAMKDYNADEVTAGTSLTIDTSSWPWPPFHQGGPASYVSMQKELIENPKKVIEKIIKGSPQAVSALAEGVAQMPSVSGLVQAKAHPNIGTIGSTLAPKHAPDTGRDLRYGVNSLMRVIYAMEDDGWEPDATEKALLQAFARLLSDVLKADHTVSPTLFDEIDRHLKAVTS